MSPMPQQHRWPMAGRYEISDNGWALIEAIVSPSQRTGPRRSDRQLAPSDRPISTLVK